MQIRRAPGRVIDHVSNIFVTGGTGYIGCRLLPALIARGHTVRALVRQGSESKLPKWAVPVRGNALDASTFRDLVAPSDTFIQLVGVAHPSPSKAAEFQRVDLASIRASVDAAKHANVLHFIYLSVAQPAPIMRDYVAVRAEGEGLLRESGLRSTCVRPWYVLGPTHRWPYAILPLYWLAMLVPSSRATAQRLYPVTLRNVVRAIAGAVDSPPDGIRVIENPELRRA